MLVKVLAVVLIVVEMQVVQVRALKCYSCTSDKDWSSCDANKKEMTCPSGINNCMKANYTITPLRGSKVTKFVKTCSNDCSSKTFKECQLKVSGSISCRINCCNRDLCNAGSVPLVSGFIMMVGVLFSTSSYVF